MKTNTRFLIPVVMALGMSLPAGQALSQAGQPATNTRSPDSFGGFVGFTDRNDADFTLGLRYEHDMGGPWSAGALVEHTPKYFRNFDATMLMGTAHYRPVAHQRLKFTGGAGVEFKDGGAGDDVIFRTGIAYDLFLEGPLTLTPNVAFNFGEGEESMTLGATLYFRF